MKTILILIVGVVVITAVYFITKPNISKQTEQVLVSPTPFAEEYNPTIDPANFVSKIDNKYFTLKSGTKYTYNEKTKEGMEKIEIVTKPETKQVMGVTTTVVQDTVWLDNVLKEDTRDFYAQDTQGNVWYFGEEVSNYENGKLTDHNGSWEAGMDGAKPGIAMKANPKVGDSYRQEYYKGKAEDMGDVVALDQKVIVPYGTFENCLQTRDWSKVDNQLNEYKYYCLQVSFLTAGDSVKEPGTEELELVNIISISQK